MFRRDKRVFLVLRTSHDTLRIDGRRVIFKLPNLLFEILIKRIFNHPRTCTPQLVFVDVDEQGRNIVQKLVDPTKMQK